MEMKNQIAISLMFLLTFAIGSPSDGGTFCPRECLCENAPLRAAPFVLTWMTSWGEDDLPDVHPNEVLHPGSMVSSGTAYDAQVDVDIIGLHTTCSLHQATNITTFLASLPSNTMVLSILQAPGSNLTIIDGKKLVGLKSLLALHLQGYAHLKEKQVSGYTPNGVSELLIHNKLIQEETIRDKGRESPEIRFFLAEDALHHLVNLQLLDLQYVRLVASREDLRLRRYSTKPLSSTSLFDMPLVKLFKLAQRVDSPPNFENLFYDEDSMPINQLRSNSDKYKLPIKMFLDDDEFSSKTNKKSDAAEDGRLTDDAVVVPYNVYKGQIEPKLAPFRFLKKLKYLRVAQASLDVIGPELLEGLHQLHTLTLEGNQIKVIPPGMFSQTSNLRHLSLAHNIILLLEKESFEGLSKLQTLDIDYNQVSILGPGSLPALPSLKTLRAYENPLTHLLPDAFASANSTESIIIGSANVSIDVHEYSFRFLNNLNSLVLNNVSMASLRKALLTGMPAIQHLTVHGNVPEIGYDAFSPTQQLVTLNLSNCHLRHLSMDAFCGLKSLEILDLSYNLLTGLSPGSFDDLVSLREMYLHHNSLITLPLGIFLPVPAKTIQLHHNPWHCTCDLLQLRPSVTNKIKRNSHTECQWNGKLTADCKDTNDAYIYDARIAPICHQPIELAGTDVYQAALRHLKCGKHHWNPRLLVESKSIETTLKVDRKNQKENLSKEAPNWLPLTAFTPEPIANDDLLEIAEKEGLEEIKESKDWNSESLPLNDQPTTGKNTTLDLPLNDQPTTGKNATLDLPLNDQPAQTSDMTDKVSNSKQIKPIDQKRIDRKQKVINLLNLKLESKKKALLANKKKQTIKTKQKLEKDKLSNPTKNANPLHNYNLKNIYQ